MKECSHVAKNGTNDYHKYKYVTAADVLEKVNSALTKHGIASVVTPSLLSVQEVTTAKGNVEQLATVEVTVTLIDASRSKVSAPVKIPLTKASLKLKPWGLNMPIYQVLPLPLPMTLKLIPASMRSCNANLRMLKITPTTIRPAKIVALPLHNELPIIPKINSEGFFA